MCIVSLYVYIHLYASTSGLVEAEVVIASSKSVRCCFNAGKSVTNALMSVRVRSRVRAVRMCRTCQRVNLIFQFRV